MSLDALLDLIISPITPKRQPEPEIATVVDTGWGSKLALTPHRLHRRDRNILIAEFVNGAKFRTVKTFTDDEVMTLISQLAQHVQTNDFPWRDVRGERQWVRLDPKTITL